MTPLPPPLGGASFVAWRLDTTRHAATWSSGEGAYRYGGRWNSKGVRGVYCSIDPATSILEVAVHKGFPVLDSVPHVLTSISIADPGAIEVIWPDGVPNSNWLVPGTPGAGQQHFGDQLLKTRRVFIIPSVISRESWNLVFDGAAFVPPAYRVLSQQAFALDPRLNPPRP
jgi:RES domain-containing protein